MMIKGINALVDAKRASSFNNAIKLVNENVQITHDQLITLENRTMMMTKAIIPVLKDFKQQINNTNDRLTRQYRMMTRAHEKYNRLFRQTHKTFQIHHLPLLMFKDYITILVGTLQRIHRQYVRYEQSNQDFNKNKEKISQYIKYAENWQVASVICSYTAMACDVLLIVAMIVFLLKYHKTMQVMLAAFLQMNTKNTGIQSVQADQIGRTYPPLFTLNLPKEEEIIDDLREITAMEYVVQVIMIIVCIAIVFIVMHFCCTKCRHTHTIFKYCFPFLPISHIVCTSRRPDLFVEVTNVTKGNGIWAHFISTGYFPSQIQLSRLIPKDDVQIETVCCIFVTYPLISTGYGNTARIYCIYNI